MSNVKLLSISSFIFVPINLTNTNDIVEMNPCFAPDGKSIVFDVVNDGSIYLMNIE